MRLLSLSVVAVVAIAGAGGGPEVNVSDAPGPQSEPTIAVDPSNAHVLLAGSNSISEGVMRIYGSTDGGATWQSAPLYPPPVNSRASCAADPGVAIDLTGRQYYSFLRSTPCTTDPPKLYVAARPGPNAPWSRAVRVAPLGRSRFDDKPAIAVDASPASPHRNRVYVVWSRLSRRGVFSIFSSHSDNAGRNWSRPVRVNRHGREVTYASVAVSRSGIVYVAWSDVDDFAVKIARSTDGGNHFGAEHTVASFAIVTIPHCGSGIVIPALRFACVQSNPIVTVDTSRGRFSGRVYVTFTQTEFYGNQGTFVQVFDRRLGPLVRSTGTQKGRAVAPAPRDQHADQFWPQSAVDPSDGTLWVCFFDTRGDPDRKRAFYSCTASRDGGTSFALPVHAASVASDETQPRADSREYGDYEGVAVSAGVAHPIWTDSRDLSTLGEEIYTTALSEADLSPPAPSG